MLFPEHESIFELLLPKDANSVYQLYQSQAICDDPKW